MIGVLDYGVGNVGAFIRIFHSQNIEAIAIKESVDFINVDKILLPGVGAFDTAMSKLNNSGLRDALDDAVLDQKKPLMGVCIGMHMLGVASDEGALEGLGYLQGRTVHMKNLDMLTPEFLLPHMGWNDISIRNMNPIWDGVDLDQGFYFLHSYTFRPSDLKSVIGVSTYYNEIVCAVNFRNIYGFQFHPEKSLQNGIHLLSNFALKA